MHSLSDALSHSEVSVFKVPHVVFRHRLSRHRFGAVIESWGRGVAASKCPAATNQPLWLNSLCSGT